MGQGRYSKTPSPTSQKGNSVESKRAKDIRSLAEYISSNKCSRIVLMLGAGVSTSAGIPDFRSPGTGLYSNLARLKLPYPEAVFEINFFRNNPIPFYTLASELYPGSYRPTPTHSFVKLLSTRGLLHMCFTQNIDTLERRAGVPIDKIVEAHGSFATQRCIDCKHPYPDEAMRECILGSTEEEARIPRCERQSCGGLVKPDIVFFGEGLPDRFAQRYTDVADADLLIIMGTSLTVHPFASLAQMADPRRCRRVLINLERVSDLGRRPGDVVLLGECDAIVKELCSELGWGDELEKTWAETEDTVRDAVANDKRAEKKLVGEAKKEKRDLEKEMEKITEALQKRLDLIDEPVPANTKSGHQGSDTPLCKDEAEEGKEESQEDGFALKDERKDEDRKDDVKL